MNKIKFTLAWDKLNEPTFTTIRSWNIEKEEYYRSHIGEDFPEDLRIREFPKEIQE